MAARGRAATQGLCGRPGPDLAQMSDHPAPGGLDADQLEPVKTLKRRRLADRPSRDEYDTRPLKAVDRGIHSVAAEIGEGRVDHAALTPPRDAGDLQHNKPLHFGVVPWATLLGLAMHGKADSFPCHGPRQFALRGGQLFDASQVMHRMRWNALPEASRESVVELATKRVGVERRVAV
jgi:hypothetical protein